MKEFAEWLADTPPSLFIQEHYLWMIPGLQSIHIAAVAMVVGSLLLLNLRIVGITGGDMTLRETAERYGPWVKGSLLVLLATGSLLVVGEPARELLTFSFWAKMVLVAIGATMAAFLQRTLATSETAHQQAWVRVFAVLALVIWMCVIFLGRLIAYDHIWGSWSPASA